jgi:GntR family transcriptional repressor for pyruvate dehydrogenase complex
MSDSSGEHAPGTGAKAALFEPLARSERLSDRVAAELLRSIAADELAPGSRLPSERELGSQFGVSRTVIREAVRSLAAKGVIEIRPGSGLRVAAVEADAVHESMRWFLRGHSAIDYPRVSEVRLALELTTARLAAQRATGADIQALELACEQMAGAVADFEAASTADVEFHRAIARATHNELFLLLLDSIGDIMLEIRRATLKDRARVDEVLAAHREIARRIAAHDEDGAEAAMRLHLQHGAWIWERIAQKLTATTSR